jgi:hypothetical protein
MKEQEKEREREREEKGLWVQVEGMCKGNSLSKEH